GDGYAMAYHAGALKEALKTQQCDPTKIQHHLARLQSTATDIVPVFMVGEKDFTNHANELSERLQQAVQSAPTTCAALATVMKPVGESCKSCHQQYR
ncbi:MAG: cytochrome c, partial [Rhodanobacter sp.]